MSGSHILLIWGSERDAAHCPDSSDVDALLAHV